MARRTKEDALATRAALLDAAECLFQKQGVAHTSLNEIAQAAGVTRGALYWHFKDKAALFNAMMDRATLPLMRRMEEASAHDSDPLDAWCRHVLDALHQIASDARTSRVLQIAMQKIEHVADMDAVMARHVEMHRLNLACEQRVFVRAAALRRVSLPADPAAIAHGFDALVSGLIYGWLLERSFDLEATARSAIIIFLRGVGLDAAVLASEAAVQADRG